MAADQAPEVVEQDSLQVAFAERRQNHHDQLVLVLLPLRGPARIAATGRLTGLGIGLPGLPPFYVLAPDLTVPAIWGSSSYN